jgi:hypothetical protein
MWSGSIIFGQLLGSLILDLNFHPFPGLTYFLHCRRFFLKWRSCGGGWLSRGSEWWSSCVVFVFQILQWFCSPMMSLCYRILLVLLLFFLDLCNSFAGLNLNVSKGQRYIFLSLLVSFSYSQPLTPFFLGLAESTFLWLEAVRQFWSGKKWYSLRSRKSVGDLVLS